MAAVENPVRGESTSIIAGFPKNLDKVPPERVAEEILNLSRMLSNW
jgi:hypothetical protein